MCKSFWFLHFLNYLKVHCWNRSKHLCATSKRLNIPFSILYYAFLKAFLKVLKIVTETKLYIWMISILTTRLHLNIKLKSERRIFYSYRVHFRHLKIWLKHLKKELLKTFFSKLVYTSKSSRKDFFFLFSTDIWRKKQV